MATTTPLASESALHRVVHALDGIPDGFVAAYRDAITRRGLAWASPAVFTVGAYVGLYGVGLVFLGPSDTWSGLAFAVGVGLVGLLAGVGLGWKVLGRPPRAQAAGLPLLRSYGLLLLVVGLAALIAYFLVIGYIPLFQPGLEQARVDAAEEGGAPLRVLSLLALPGTWILVAQAAAARDRRGLLLSSIAVVVVAVGFTLTGNRSPAFTTVEVALLAGLLAAGFDRIGGRGIALLGAIGVVFVVSAGLFGAFRLASREVYGPPVPGVPEPPPDYAKLTAIAITGYLVVPINNLTYSLDAIPNAMGWRYGMTYVQPLLTVLPGKQTTFDADLKAALDQRYEGGGTVPGLLGEAYANFGPLGWLLVPFVVGTAITMLYRYCRAWAPESAALYAYAIAHVSLGGPLSGLAVASVFPYEAYVVLGFALFGLPIVGRRLAARRS